MSTDFDNFYAPAWQVTWQNKKLWLFSLLGLLDAIAGFNGRWLQSVLASLREITKVEGMPGVVNLSTWAGWLKVFEYTSTEEWLAIGGETFLRIIVTLISVVALACLIEAYNLIYIQGRFSLGELLLTARNSFWQLLIAHSIYLTLTLISVSNEPTGGLVDLLLGAAACIVPILLWLSMIIVHIANFAIVIDRVSFYEAIKKVVAILLKYSGAFIRIWVLGFIFIIGIMITARLFANIIEYLYRFGDFNIEAVSAIFLGLLYLIPLAIIPVFYSFYAASITRIYRRYSQRSIPTEASFIVSQ